MKHKPYIIPKSIDTLTDILKDSPESVLILSKKSIDKIISSVEAYSIGNFNNQSDRKVISIIRNGVTLHLIDIDDVKDIKL